MADRRGCAASAAETSDPLGDVLRLRELAEAVAGFAGAFTASRASLASGACWLGLRELLPDLMLSSSPTVYIFGGHGGRRAPNHGDLRPLDNVIAMAMVNGSLYWNNLPQMPLARMHCAAAAGAGRIYVVGGCDASEHPCHSAFSFCPSGAKWQTLPRLEMARHSCGAVCIGGLLCVAGGDGGNEGMLASAECLNVKGADGERVGRDRRWVTLPPMSSPRAKCSAAVFDRASFVVVGGADDGYRSTGVVERLILSHGDSHGMGRSSRAASVAASWEQLSPLRTPRFSCAAAGTGCLVVVAGGVCDGWSPLDTVECYQVDGAGRRGGEWHLLGRLDVARRSCGLVAAAGFVYAFGGISHGAKNEASVERLAIGVAGEPIATGAQWESLPNMPSARSCCAAAAAWS
eukprot:TRINITY_DN8141_c0_g2_i1.p1 TRINITY_DN8141_c0_g2~~TRINITY_DN8141_c0_g2_i1.p1  ORF type:complete len:404 (-),score=67.10 TRINITY_DN8141_c0_g2_i1:132-1343(-)